MLEFFVGLIGCILLYWLGTLLVPEYHHVPIQQELIKMENQELSMLMKKVSKDQANLEGLGEKEND